MTNKFYIPLVIFCFCMSISSYAQVGIGTTDPDASAILDINSTSAGVLMPRMTTLQREAISNPSNGLLVFDTDLNAFYYYQTDTWIALITENSASDYTGWGRLCRWYLYFCKSFITFRGQPNYLT